MTKRIILTTMSTLNGANKNFYIVNGKYCDGISQLEAGTKYYLSKIEEINEIVVIGSDATINENELKREKTPRLLSKKYPNRNVIKEYIENKFPDKPSAYSVYSYDIKNFIMDEESNNSPLDYGEKKVELVEQEHINQIIEEAKKNIDKTTGDAEYYELLLKLVNDRLSNDIESEYLTKEEKAKYLFSSKITSDDEDIKTKADEIKNNKSLSLFGKEINLRSLLDKFQKKTIVSSINSEKYDEEIKKYQEDLMKLTKELDDINSKRKQNEQQYAKEQIYQRIDKDQKLSCKEENKNVKIRFVSLKVKNKKSKEFDNFNGILKALKDKKSNEDIEIYMDVQGGFRTDGYLRSAVLSFLNNLNANGQGQRVQLKQVIATAFSRTKFFNSIIDETVRYRITDLVSGMNAFINYGKANQLVQTWNEVGNDKDNVIKNIFKNMQEVDQALSLCDVNLLLEAMKNLNGNMNRRISVNDSNDAFIKVFKDNILEDYKGIIDDKNNVDVFELVKWAMRKGFIQQAITLIESKMPEQMIKDGYFYIGKANNEKRINWLREKETKDFEANEPEHVIIQQVALPFYYEYREKYFGFIKKEVKAKNTKEKKKINPLDLKEGFCKCFENEEILRKYGLIWAIRNNTNHASKNVMSYDETEKHLKEFISCYEQFRSIDNNKKKEMMSDLFTEEEILILKGGKQANKVSYALVMRMIRPNIQNNQQKSERDAYQKKVTELFDKKIPEEKRYTYIYPKIKKGKYTFDITNYTDTFKKIIIPKNIYNENIDYINKEIRDCTIYVIEKTTKSYKIVETKEL